jgi:uncharacterized membrane protein (GlpM family)
VSEPAIIVIRALVGGTFVVAFALISETLKPKEFAGIFSAAPSVALASLLLTILTRGPGAAASGTEGMVVAAFGMMAYCLASVVLVRRLGAMIGSLAAFPAWLVVAVGGYLIFLR